MKTFNEWLCEEKEKINVTGWTKITKTSFINDIKENKSLFLASDIVSNKPKDYGNTFLKTVAVPSKLLSIIDARKKNNEWRTVVRVNSNSIKFSNNSSLFFDQQGEKSFYKMKLKNGTCYLSYLIASDDSNPFMDSNDDNYVHVFIFYYIEN